MSSHGSLVVENLVDSQNLCDAGAHMMLKSHSLLVMKLQSS